MGPHSGTLAAGKWGPEEFHTAPYRFTSASNKVTHISLAKQVSELTESKEVGNPGSEEITIEILRGQKLPATIFLTWRNMLPFKDGNSE